jgi:hypothetical protein
MSIEDLQAQKLRGRLINEEKLRHMTRDVQFMARQFQPPETMKKNGRPKKVPPPPPGGQSFAQYMASVIEGSEVGFDEASEPQDHRHLRRRIGLQVVKCGSVGRRQLSKLDGDALALIDFDGKVNFTGARRESQKLEKHQYPGYPQNHQKPLLRVLRVPWVAAFDQFSPLGE